MNRSEHVSACIKCGQCTRHCRFLSKYNSDLSDMEQTEKFAYHCFLCGKCKEVCPKNIDGRELFLKQRRRHVTKNDGKLMEKGYRSLLWEKSSYKFKNYKHITKGSVFFPGCNFPSFFPKTTKRLSALLLEAASIGTVFDCCGKPVGELGLEEQEHTIIENIEAKMREGKVTEIITACPNCYHYLKSKSGMKITSIYEKLEDLGLVSPLDEKQFHIFSPCPDRESKLLFQQISPFLNGAASFIEEIQCCGLGGCAGLKEPQISDHFSKILQESRYEKIYTYCASCSGKLVSGGCNNVRHILVELMGTEEQPDVKKSLLNRMSTKFW